MNTKRILAVALSAAMVFGSTITAFADDPDTTAATGTGTGTGTPTNEGYVNTLKTKVLVPTQETVNDGLSFHVDPQRLIAGTTKAKYTGWTLPETGDTGVYFLTGEKTYTNNSNTFNIANLGTGAVTFTIKVEAVPSETAENDIPFDSKANVNAENPTAAKLYIGALIGKNATAVAVSDTAIEKKVVLAGKPDNYEYTYGASGYDYVVKSGENTWDAVPVSFEGAITNFATDKSVPGIKLTYSWAAKGQSDETDSSVTVDTAYKVSAAPATVAPTTMGACSISGTTVACRLVAGQSADASKITSVKIGDTVITTSGSTKYEVASSGAIKILGVSVTTGTVTIVYDGTTYAGTF